MPEIERTRAPLERIARDQARAQFREATFRFPGKLRVEMFGNDQLEHGIAEEFEPLIIEMFSLRFVPKTGVRQRLRQKQRIAKLVANAFFHRIHVPAILSESLP